MAKVGTAHLEIKPVLNEEALAEIGRRIEQEVAAAVERGINRYHALIASSQGGIGR